MKSILKKLSWHFIVTALPLLIYPFVFIASIMSLAGGLTGEESFLLIVSAQLFLWTSLCYPLVYGVAMLGAIITDNKARKRWIYLPYWYLMSCIMFFILWWMLSV